MIVTAVAIKPDASGSGLHALRPSVPVKDLTVITLIVRARALSLPLKRQTTANHPSTLNWPKIPTLGITDVRLADLLKQALLEWC